MLDCMLHFFFNIGSSAGLHVRLNVNMCMLGFGLCAGLRA